MDASCIVQKIQNNLEFIKKIADIEFMLLFGSYVIEERNLNFASDIDIVVSIPDFQPLDYTRNPLVLIAVQIDQILGVDNTQVVRWEDLPLQVKASIYKNHRVIFIKDPEKFREEKERTLKLIWDNNIWYRNYRKMALENMSLDNMSG